MQVRFGQTWNPFANLLKTKTDQPKPPKTEEEKRAEQLAYESRLMNKEEARRLLGER